MEFDMGLVNGGIFAFPDFPYAAGPRPWSITEVETVHGNSTNVVSIQASAGLVDQDSILYYPATSE